MSNAAASAAPTVKKVKQVRRRGAVRPARVLIAEDDRAFRAMLLWAFEEEGYEVVAVANGNDLLRVLGSSMLPRSGVKELDLIVSDLRMPGWSGLAGLEKLADNPWMPPIVLITAFGSEEVRQRAKAAGVVVVMDKPFDLDELTALADTLIVRPHPDQ